MTGFYMKRNTGLKWVKHTIVISNVNYRVVTNSFQADITFPYPLKTLKNQIKQAFPGGIEVKL